MWSGPYPGRRFGAMLDLVWVTVSKRIWIIKGCLLVREVLWRRGTHRIWWLLLKIESFELRRLSIVWLIHLLSLWLVLMVAQSSNHIGMAEVWRKPIQDLLKASCVDLTNGVVFEVLRLFQDHVPKYKIIVCDGLKAGRFMFSGNSRSAKKLYLLNDRDHVHHNVITNHKGAMAKQYICTGCNTLYDFTHVCDKVCSLFTATPTCIKYQTNYCSTCKRRYLSTKCLHNYLTVKMKGKLVCQWRQLCRNFSCLVRADSKHECFKK